MFFVNYFVSCRQTSDETRLKTGRGKKVPGRFSGKYGARTEVQRSATIDSEEGREYVRLRISERYL